MLTKLTGKVTVLTDPAYPDAHLIEVEQVDRAFTLRTSGMTVEHVRDCTQCTRMAVHTHTIYTEREGERMFGFTDSEERNMFVTLNNIPKMGPERALAVLSAFTPEELWTLAGHGDSKPVEAVKGIGASNARTLIEGLQSVGKKVEKGLRGK